MSCIELRFSERMNARLSWHAMTASSSASNARTRAPATAIVFAPDIYSAIKQPFRSRVNADFLVLFPRIQPIYGLETDEVIKA